MPFRFIKQYDAMDCGPTCLAMVCMHYGKEIPLHILRERAGIGKEGVNLLGIGESAESIGFRTRSVQLSFPSLVKDALLPAILHWDQKHFVVLFRVTAKKLYVADPAHGIITYSPAEFNRHWISNKVNDTEEGIALLLEPTPELYNFKTPGEAIPQKKKNVKRIVHYIWPHKKLIMQLLIGLAVASLMQLVLPFLTQSIVDVGINTHNLRFVYIILLAQLFLFAGRLVVDFVRSWILLHISTRINLSILTDFLIKLMKLPVSFFDSKKTGDILQRMSDHQRIESFLTGSSLSVLFSLINLIIFSVVLAVYNKYIFSVFLVASIIYSIWIFLFLKKRKALDYKKFDAAAREQSTTIQLIQGMQEIKMHGTEKHMRWNWERLQAKIFTYNMKSLGLSQWQQTGAFFINEGKNIFITFLSAKAVIDGQMTLGSMLAVQYIIGQLTSPVEQMISFVQGWQNAKISLDRLNEIHSMQDEEPLHHSFLYELPPAFRRQLTGGQGVTIQPAAKVNGPVLHEQTHFSAPLLQPGEMIPEHDGLSNRPFTIHGATLKEQEVIPASIILHQVSFAYPGAGNEPVLNNIDLTIPHGKTTAIVGVSGSGKTTLLKLLLKFYDPLQGEIRLQHTPLADISHRVWRKHCGVVMQDSFIFSDTIARNIAVGEDQIDMEKLQHAVHMANISELVENLPSGFNTKIGAEGTGISMGQRQRILIARAIYRDPDFIFFDEATNSLDANNESVIIRNLASFFTGRTVIVVAHRLSTVKHADQIVVLSNGSIAEKGTHEQLIHRRGEYYTLVKNQLELGE